MRCGWEDASSQEMIDICQYPCILPYLLIPDTDLNETGAVSFTRSQKFAHLLGG